MPGGWEDGRTGGWKGGREDGRTGVRSVTVRSELLPDRLQDAWRLHLLLLHPCQSRVYWGRANRRAYGILLVRVLVSDLPRKSPRHHLRPGVASAVIIGRSHFRRSPQGRGGRYGQVGSEHLRRRHRRRSRLGVRSKAEESWRAA